MVDQQVADWLISDQDTLAIDNRLFVDISIVERAYSWNRVLVQLWDYFWLPVEFCFLNLWLVIDSIKLFGAKLFRRIDLLRLKRFDVTIFLNFLGDLDHSETVLRT